MRLPLHGRELVGRRHGHTAQDSGIHWLLVFVQIGGVRHPLYGTAATQEPVSPTAGVPGVLGAA